MFTTTDRTNIARIIRGIARSKAGKAMSTHEIGRRAAARYYGAASQFDANYAHNATVVSLAHELLDA